MSDPGPGAQIQLVLNDMLQSRSNYSKFIITEPKILSIRVFGKYLCGNTGLYRKVGKSLL